MLHVEFGEGVKTRFTKDDKDRCDKEWNYLKEKVKVIIKDDPTYPESVALALRCHKLIIGLYSKEFIAFKPSVLEDGFKEDNGSSAVDRGMSSEMVEWLDKAMDTYWKKHLTKILNKIGTKSEPEVLKEWNDSLEEMFGHDKLLKVNYHPMLLD